MKALRLRDQVEPERPVALDPAAFAGTWINTSGSTQGLSRLDLEVRGGELVVLSHGPQGGDQIAWEDSILYGGIASPSPLAFTARREFGVYEGLLQGNLNLGLLVLGTYKTYPGGRIGYFSREFFAVQPALAPIAGRESKAAVNESLFGGIEQPAAIDLEPMLGRWRNADAGSRGIAEIRIAEHHGGTGVRVHGTGARGPVDWGDAEVEVCTCVDEAGVRTLSLLASYDFGFMESRLQLRIPGGTLALADLTKFKDGSGRTNYFTREFFYHDGAPA